jgi:hypothetical protein
MQDTNTMTDYVIYDDVFDIYTIKPEALKLLESPLWDMLTPAQIKAYFRSNRNTLLSNPLIIEPYGLGLDPDGCVLVWNERYGTYVCDRDEIEYVEVYVKPGERVPKWFDRLEKRPDIECDKNGNNCEWTEKGKEEFGIW